MRAALFLWKPQYHLQPVYANLSGGQSTVHGACTASPSSGPSWVQVAILVKEETSSTGLSRASKATHSASPGPFHPHSHVQWIFVSEYISLNNKTFITLSSFKNPPLWSPYTSNWTILSLPFPFPRVFINVFLSIQMLWSPCVTQSP